MTIRPVKPKGVISLTTGRDEFTVRLSGGRAEVLPGAPGRFDAYKNLDVPGPLPGSQLEFAGK